MNGYASSTSFNKIQKRVNRFVGVPITWLVYLTWQLICWLAVKANQGWTWLRQVRQRKAEA